MLSAGLGAKRFDGGLALSPIGLPAAATWPSSRPPMRSGAAWRQYLDDELLDGARLHAKGLDRHIPAI